MHFHFTKYILCYNTKFNKVIFLWILDFSENLRPTSSQSRSPLWGHMGSALPVWRRVVCQEIYLLETLVTQCDLSVLSGNRIIIWSLWMNHVFKSNFPFLVRPACSPQSVPLTSTMMTSLSQLLPVVIVLKST